MTPCESRCTASIASLLGSFGEAEDRLAIGVEPVGVIPNVVLVLCLKVEHMGRGQFLGGEVDGYVAVHKHRHDRSIEVGEFGRSPIATVRPA